MSIKLRPLQAADENAWRELFSDYGSFYKIEVPDAAFAEVLRWIQDPDEPFWCTVAEDTSGLIGFTQFQLMHRSLSGGKVVYLSDLFVKPDVRSAGTGRMLIDSVFSFARERNIGNVRWLTQDYNYTARHLYDTYQQKSDFILYSINT